MPLDNDRTHAEFNIRPLGGLNSTAAAEAFIGVFAGHHVPPPRGYDGRAFERRFVTEHVDRFASFVAFAGGRIAGVVVIARRRWSAHISALGVAEEFRRRGLATELVRRACEAAEADGVTRTFVEVPADAADARRVYVRLGFEETRALSGWRRMGASQPDAQGLDGLREEDPALVAEIYARVAVSPLPWYLAPASMFGCASPSLGVSLQERAFAIVSPSDDRLGLRAIVTLPEHRRSGYCRRLLDACAAKWPDREIATVPFVPVAISAPFESMGFESYGPHLEMCRARPR